MDMAIIAFILGLMLGGFIGIMSMCVISCVHDERDYQRWIMERMSERDDIR